LCNWVAANRGTKGSDCRLVKMLSRPNMVMNHGSPAAGRLRPRATGGEKRRAARSTRLRRYVRLSGSQSHSSRGGSATQRSRSRARFLRAAGGTIDPTEVMTFRSVDQLPCAPISREKVKLFLSTFAGSDDEIVVVRENVPRSYVSTSVPSSTRVV